MRSINITRKILAVIVLFIGAAVARAQTPAEKKFDPLFDVPNFELIDQNGKKLSNRDLRDTVWIADFVFTNCAGPCPLMTAKLAELQQRISRQDVKFVSFTVDPRRDTPQVLKEYADRFGADHSRWSFLTGTLEQMAAVARGMKVAAKEESDQSVTHSTMFMLVDRAGHVAGLYRLSDDNLVAHLSTDATDLADRHAGFTVADLPIVNASLNATSAVLLIAAYICIRRRKIRAHATLMITAVLCAAAFLTCYVIYHLNVHEKSSGLPAGLFKTAYLLMLLTHVLLAIVILPMIGMTLFRAYRREWDRHRRIARPTFWIWMYVSVTGVVIYLVLYHLAPAMYAAR